MFKRIWEKLTTPPDDIDPEYDEEELSKSSQAQLPWNNTTLNPGSRALLRTRIINISSGTLLESVDDENIFNITEHLAFFSQMLELDKRLRTLRYKLVPARVSETVFWARYMNKVQYQTSLCTTNGSPSHASALEPTTVSEMEAEEKIDQSELFSDDDFVL
ncbi:hypothetical protein PCE1_002344 [Barthelona sp. PCE]